jgi:hypothetical protein
LLQSYVESTDQSELPGRKLAQVWTVYVGKSTLGVFDETIQQERELVGF